MAAVLTIQIHRKGEQYTAKWSSEGIGTEGFAASTPLAAAQGALDDIKRQGTMRKRGRPDQHSLVARYLVRG